MFSLCTAAYYVLIVNLQIRKKYKNNIKNYPCPIKLIVQYFETTYILC